MTMGGLKISVAPMEPEFELDDTKRKPLKKKKSLPRLFLKYERSSKSKPSSPAPTHDSGFFESRSHSVATSRGNDTPALPSPALPSPALPRPSLGNGAVLSDVERNHARTRSRTFGAPDGRGISYENSPPPLWRTWSEESPALSGNSSISPLSRNPTKSSDARGASHSAHTSISRADGLKKSYVPYKRPSTASEATDPSRAKDSPTYAAMKVGSARWAEFPNLKPPPIPDDWYNGDGPRESVRSGVSMGSSLLDSSSTQRSSVFTRVSRRSDTSLELLDDEDDAKGGLTVDEMIDLYSAGFENEEFDLPEGHPMKAEQEERRRSRNALAGANGAAEGNTLFPPTRHPIAAAQGAPGSVALVNGNVFHSLFPEPPPVQAPTAKYDQYGFRKASRDVTTEQYNWWWADYQRFQKRRSLKWIALLHEHGLPARKPTQFPPRSAKVQRFVRKGIPPVWRGAAWFHYAGGQEFLWSHPGHYADLVLQSQTAALNPADREAVERDLHRTFPDNMHFKPDGADDALLSPATAGGNMQAVPVAPETPLLSALRRVLCAFAIDHPRIGYCQSLNFIAGMLLLFLPEEKAFWMLHIVTTQYLPGTHDLSLEGANVDVWVLMLALKEHAPAAWAKIGGEQDVTPPMANGGGAPSGAAPGPDAALKMPPVSLCTTSWFMSLFIGTLPTESVLRVWDVLFYDGAKTLFRAALAVFRLNDAELRRVHDPVEAFGVVQALPRRMLDARALLECACGRGALGRRWLERRRAERKEWYRAERLGERRRKESRDAAGGRAGGAEADYDTPAPPSSRGVDSSVGSIAEDDARSDAEPAKARGTGWWPKIGTKKGRSQ